MKIREEAIQFYAAHIPARVLRGLVAYAEQMLEPGGFVQAVLANDLCKAVGRADPESLAALPMIVVFVMNEFPELCWGSEQMVKHWLECGRRARLDESAPNMKDPPDEDDEDDDDGEERHVCGATYCGDQP